MATETMALPRPKTRGELARRLRAGEACEVAAYVAESTDIMLRGWLNLSAFTVAPSANQGWAVFSPVPEAQP